jgi:hypothetical protein
MLRGRVRSRTENSARVDTLCGSRCSLNGSRTDWCGRTLAHGCDNAAVQEAAVRAAVARRILEDDPHGGDTRIVHELGLCQAQARIDVAAINGQLVGWEIKTRGDRLDRLPRQEAVYSRVFDQVWLVADVRHITPANSMIPQWWGVLEIACEVDGSCALRVARVGRTNPSVDLHALVRLLWRSEALEELDRLGIADGVRHAPRRVLWPRLADAVPTLLTNEDLRARVRQRLKERDGWRSDPRPTSGGD